MRLVSLCLYTIWTRWYTHNITFLHELSHTTWQFFRRYFVCLIKIQGQLITIKLRHLGENKKKIYCASFIRYEFSLFYLRNVCAHLLLHVLTKNVSPPVILSRSLLFTVCIFESISLFSWNGRKICSSCDNVLKNIRLNCSIFPIQFIQHAKVVVVVFVVSNVFV